VGIGELTLAPALEPRGVEDRDTMLERHRREWVAVEAIQLEALQAYNARSSGCAGGRLSRVTCVWTGARLIVFLGRHGRAVICGT
jgi:hypothetical protein